jgi:hypothetical protein
LEGIHHSEISSSEYLGQGRRDNQAILNASSARVESVAATNPKHYPLCPTGITAIPTHFGRFATVKNNR